MAATTLRYVLLGIIAAMVIGLSVGGWWLEGLLKQRAQESNQARIDAEVSTVELQQLKQLEAQFARDKDIIERTRQIAASADQYQYQDQVIRDLTRYANRYGIGINAFNFEEADKKAASPGGANKTPFTVTLRGPLKYEVFLRFLGDIETNLTKMQVTSLTLSPDKDPTLIANPTVSLEVYIKG